MARGFESSSSSSSSSRGWWWRCWARCGVELPNSMRENGPRATVSSLFSAATAIAAPAVISTARLCCAESHLADNACSRWPLVHNDGSRTELTSTRHATEPIAAAPATANFETRTAEDILNTPHTMAPWRTWVYQSKSLDSGSWHTLLYCRVEGCYFYWYVKLVLV
mmetsp:Transcript_80205/g.160082  ORF Transcript_80205/g.160082 Transcript_80205/m.160082 type:complete len:166 (-) Transcript_80205:14-511(-)